MSNQALIARTEFAAALNQIASERNIPVEVILDAVKSALVASFNKDFLFSSGFPLFDFIL